LVYSEKGGFQRGKAGCRGEKRKAVGGKRKKLGGGVRQEKSIWWRNKRAIFGEKRSRRGGRYAVRIEEGGKVSVNKTKRAKTNVGWNIPSGRGGGGGQF